MIKHDEKNILCHRNRNIYRIPGFFFFVYLKRFSCIGGGSRAPKTVLFLFRFIARENVFENVSVPRDVCKKKKKSLKTISFSRSIKTIIVHRECFVRLFSIVRLFISYA